MSGTYLLQCAACGDELRVAPIEAAAPRRCRACGAPVIPTQSLPIQVTDATWDAEIVGTTPAVVVVWGEACSTCAEYEPSVRLMASSLYGSARVLQLNIDRNPSTAARFQVTGVPTVLLFREGKLLATLPGPRGERGLRERLGLSTASATPKHP